MDLPLEESVDAWIDSNHLMRKIASLGRFVFMTDGAIGRREEPNLRHVTINLGKEADRSRIIPILTTKHSLEYCLEFAQRAYIARIHVARRSRRRQKRQRTPLRRTCL